MTSVKNRIPAAGDPAVGEDAAMLQRGSTEVASWRAPAGPRGAADDDATMDAAKRQLDHDVEAACDAA